MSNKKSREDYNTFELAEEWACFLFQLHVEDGFIKMRRVKNPIIADMTVSISGNIHLYGGTTFKGVNTDPFMKVEKTTGNRQIWIVRNNKVYRIDAYRVVEYALPDTYHLLKSYKTHKLRADKMYANMNSGKTPKFTRAGDKI